MSADESTATETSIGILIADDQALVRAGFRMILEAEDDLRVLAEASDGAEAVEAARVHRPDIVLMDIRMPNLDGIEATRRILTAGKEPPRVLMLTTFDLDEYVFDALRAGASGFCSRMSRPSSSSAASASSPRATRCYPRR
jgi:DNA-binding NarL/FixJ family response regulator